MDRRSDAVAPLVVAAAAVALNRLMEQVGKPGFAEMGRLPWLLAQVDQHAAEVRDVLVDRHGRVPAVRLAAYADGVVDTAARHGWHADRALADGWTAGSWPLTRLLAVCLLARADLPDPDTATA